ncbi:MAG: TMEM165/GDT1 family protein [Lachnospiraceae bacterium]|nr:TMEM165/GDT1 family protein [Lachnospiraceae bacterium]
MFFTFLTILGTEFIAEMGDKTQLMLIGLTSRYKLRDIILGTAFAILVLNGVAVVLGGLLGSVLPTGIIKLVAGVLFLYFAVSSLKKDSDEEEDAKEEKISFAPMAVFMTFIIAELGDKTQLTAAAFGASYGFSMALVVWIACSIGLFMADILGLLVGYLLKKRVPEEAMKYIAFVIFAFYGVYTLYEAAHILWL